MKKIFTSIFLMLAVLAMTAGTAFAQEPTLLTGTVQSVVLEADPTSGETFVIVELLDETTGETQTVKIRLETAEIIGLVATDPITGESTVAEDAVGKSIEIDMANVIDDEETGQGEQDHPVGSALSNFFGGLFGVDYDTIMTAHEDGIGFGVIAQALWLTNQIEGDSATFEALLEAKQSGNYDDIVLADGSTPDNWGDVVKSLKKGNNLGSVMSGKAEKDETTGEDTMAAGNEPGNGKNGGEPGKSNNSNGSGNNNDNGKGKDNGKGNGESNGKGGGRP